MSEPSWQMDLEFDSPIPVKSLDVVIEEGRSLSFPLSRAALHGDVAGYWNVEHVKRLADIQQQDLLEALGAAEASGDYATVKEMLGGLADDIVKDTFNASKPRYDGATMNGNTLTVQLGLTDFINFMCTNIQAWRNPDFLDKIQQAGKEDADDPFHYLANVPGVAVAAETSDGYVPVGFRGERAAFYPGVPHVIAAMTRFGKDYSVDFMTNMKRCMVRELGIGDEDIVSLDFMGVARNMQTGGHPEFLYRAKLGVSKAEIEEGWEADDRDHSQMGFYDTDGLRSLLSENTGTMVPAGEACLTNYLTHK
jgi:hypothetical protein